MADTNTYDLIRKTEKWTTKEKFNALPLSDIPVGSEYNLTGAIEEGELDSALQTKINKFAAIPTPTAESAVVLGTDGTTSTKALSELCGKLYKHKITLSSDQDSTVDLTIYSSKNTAYTFEEIANTNEIYDGRYTSGSLVGKSSGYIIADGDFHYLSVWATCVNRGDQSVVGVYIMELTIVDFTDTVTEL